MAELEYQNQALLQQNDELHQENEVINMKLMQLENNTKDYQHQAIEFEQEHQKQADIEQKLRQQLLEKDRERAAMEDRYQSALEMADTRER